MEPASFSSQPYHSSLLGPSFHPLLCMQVEIDTLINAKNTSMQKVQYISQHNVNNVPRAINVLHEFCHERVNQSSTEGPSQLLFQPWLWQIPVHIQKSFQQATWKDQKELEIRGTRPKNRQVSVPIMDARMLWLPIARVEKEPNQNHRIVVEIPFIEIIKCYNNYMAKIIISCIVLAFLWKQKWSYNFYRQFTIVAINGGNSIKDSR